MAEDGVAFASITAQYISAFLVVLNLFKRKDEDVCRLRVKELRLYKGVSNVILMLGIPAGIGMLYLLWLIFLYRQVSTHLVRLWYQVMRLRPMLMH